MDKQIIGLGPVSSLLKRYVHEKKAAGVAAYIAKGGKVIHRQYEGWADTEARRPISDDTIYRVFSMSKVVTSAALLQLYERGLFKMYDPVSDFLPAFKDQQVFVQIDGKVETVPAERPVTMRDLFTMTSGIPYPGDGSPAARAMAEAFEKLGDRDVPLNETMEIVGKIPLDFQPGDHWMYGFSIDVLGAVIEAISGKTLGEYLKENIFEPLNMPDTGFYLTPAQALRLSEIYFDEGGALRKAPAGEFGNDPCAPPAMESGGGGLFSTLEDYARFAQMLLNGGTLDGARILGRKTIDLMRTNHLTPKQRETDNWDTQRGYGYGLGVRVRMENEVAGSNGSVGEWGWDGMPGCWFCVDPVEDMIAVFMVQRMPGAHYMLIPPFMAAVYGTL